MCCLCPWLGRSSSGAVEICYVLPVLLMTPCFYIIGPLARYVCIFVSDQEESVGYRAGAKCAIYDCLVD